MSAEEIAREVLKAGLSLDELKEAMIREAIIYWCGSATRAAKALKMSRSPVAKRWIRMKKQEGLTLDVLRKLKHAQRSLPLKAAPRTKAANA